MRETTKQSPLDRGEVVIRGRCQVCGEEADTIAVPGAAEPNQFCPRCAIEYAEAPGVDDE
jgi:hypothetical protein